jgi:hypothetical protein
MPTDEIVHRTKVAKEFDVSPRTVKRWEAERRPGFDQPVVIAGRVYHPRMRLEAAKVLGDCLKALPLDAKA